MKISFVTTTATNASKGKEVLRGYGISSEVKKVRGGTAAGCLFSIVATTDEPQKVMRILENAGIRIIRAGEVAK